MRCTIYWEATRECRMWSNVSTVISARFKISNSSDYRETWYSCDRLFRNSPPNVIFYFLSIIFEKCAKIILLFIVTSFCYFLFNEFLRLKFKCGYFLELIFFTDIRSVFLCNIGRLILTGAKWTNGCANEHKIIAKNIEQKVICEIKDGMRNVTKRC